jgi:hypothetical protein
VRGWFLALALAPSCSLLTDLGGLRDGDGGLDAASDVAADVMPDAGSDAALGWCATKKDASFCDDFDESPLGKLWTVTHADDGGALALDDAQSTSQPNALVVSSAGTSVNAFLGYDHTGNVSSVSCELEVRPELVLATGGVWMLDVLFHTNDSTLSYYEISFERTETGCVFYEEIDLSDGGYSAPQSPAPLLPYGTWTHVAMDLDFPSATATLTYNGIKAMTAKLQHPPTASKDELVTVGIVGDYSPDGGTWALRFDDVACTFNP